MARDDPLLGCYIQPKGSSVPLYDIISQKSYNPTSLPKGALFVKRDNLQEYFTTWLSTMSNLPPVLFTTGIGALLELVVSPESSLSEEDVQVVEHVGDTLNCLFNIVYLGMHYHANWGSNDTLLQGLFDSHAPAAMKLKEELDAAARSKMSMNEDGLKRQIHSLLQQLKKQATEYQLIIDELQTRLQLNVDDVRLRAELQTQLEAANAQLESNRLHISELTNKNHDLEIELTNVSDNNHQLDQRCQQLVEENHAIQSQIESSTFETQEQLVQKETMIEELQSQLESKESENQKLQVRLKQSIQDATQFHALFSTLKLQLDQSRQETSDLTSQLQTVQQELHEAQTQNADTSQIQAFTQQLKQLQQNLSSKDAQNQQLSKENRAIQSQAQNQIQSLQGQLNAAETQLHRLQGSGNHVNSAEVASLKQQITELQTSNQKLNELNIAMGGQVSDVDNKPSQKIILSTPASSDLSVGKKH